MHCLAESLNYIVPEMEKAWGPGNLPELGIVCGSGLHTLASALDQTDLKIPFKNIPHFSVSAVVGHPGVMVFGKIAGLRIILLQGRIHYYEGNTPQQASYPVLLLFGLGVSSIVLSNAAGGLSTNYSVGDVMLITDHIYIAGFSGMSPLVGPHIAISEILSILSHLPHYKFLETRIKDQKSERFVPLNGVYSMELQRMFGQAVVDSKAMEKKRVHCGVYAYAAGPQYETPAETLALRNMGADAVGMSTVPEVLVAAQFGVKLFAFSLITNEIPIHTIQRSTEWLFEQKTMGNGAAHNAPSHAEVIESANASANKLVSVMKRFCELYAASVCPQ